MDQQWFTSSLHNVDFDENNNPKPFIPTFSLAKFTPLYSQSPPSFPGVITSAEMKEISPESVIVSNSPEQCQLDRKSKRTFEGNETPCPIPGQNSAEKQGSLSSHRGQQTTPQSPTLRRGPGRPSKNSLLSVQHRVSISIKSSNVNQGPKRSRIIMKRECHNDSAKRSRTKFKSALDELWQEMPEEVRSQALEKFAPRQLCRAEKVEAVISYIRDVRLYVENRKWGNPVFE